MTATYLIRPFTVPPEATPKPRGQAIEGTPWGTPTGEEITSLLDKIEFILDRALLRCQAALPVATETLRGQEVAA